MESIFCNDMQSDTLLRVFYKPDTAKQHTSTICSQNMIFRMICKIRTNKNMWQDFALLISLMWPPSDLKTLFHSYTYCTIFIYPIFLFNFIRKF